jgi:hyperosmotically inducible periplasmic protein
MKALLLIGGAILAALPAWAGSQGLRERVEGRLARIDFETGDVRVAVSGEVVTLDGTLPTVLLRRAAERAARKETKHVVSRLHVEPVERSDADVSRAAVDVVLNDPQYGVFDAVGLEVTDGVARLVGSVRRPYLKDAIEARVAAVPGLRDLRNEIDVQPVSIFDDRLRLQLYRVIYGDSLFSTAAHWPSPPVRILVENGRVTLVGIVASSLEQTKLTALANSTLAFEVKNRVTVADKSKPKRKGQAPPTITI